MERILEADITDFDLRYESCRIRDQKIEDNLLLSILKSGIRDPLRGIEGEKTKILLDGFKRMRCAKKLKIEIIPYISMGNDQAMGIVELIRGSFSKGLSILEQSKLINELRNSYGMSIAEIADQLGKSKTWVRLRVETEKKISRCVAENILGGKFPARSYLYTIAPLTRVYGLKDEELDRFVNLVSGKKISTRDIDLLARAYFTGSARVVDQINNGKLEWSLAQLKKEQAQEWGQCTQVERKVLKHLESIQNNMQKFIIESGDNRLKTNIFWSQANLLTEAILEKMESFSTAISRFYDQSR